MSKQTVILAGEPSLTQRSLEVPLSEILTQPIQKLIDDMIDTMHDYQGVGLAAPQIGHNLRIFCYSVDHNARYPDAPSIPLTVMINPVITRHSAEQIRGFEGCLSLPSLRGEVPRYTWLEITASDRAGNLIKKRCEGFEARIIQHELDHLDGHFFIERLNDFSRFGFQDVLQKKGMIP